MIIPKKELKNIQLSINTKIYSIEKEFNFDYDFRKPIPYVDLGDYVKVDDYILECWYQMLKNPHCFGDQVFIKAYENSHIPFNPFPDSYGSGHQEENSGSDRFRRNSGRVYADATEYGSIAGHYPVDIDEKKWKEYLQKQEANDNSWKTELDYQKWFDRKILDVFIDPFVFSKVICVVYNRKGEKLNDN